METTKKGQDGKWFPLKNLIFFQRKNEDKFLLQKEKNVNQKWKVVSFFILKIWFFFQRKKWGQVSFTKREKCQSKMESDFFF